MMLTWPDKQAIFTLSVYFSATTETVHRRNKDKQMEDVIKPTAIVEYIKDTGS